MSTPEQSDHFDAGQRSDVALEHDASDLVAVLLPEELHAQSRLVNDLEVAHAESRSQIEREESRKDTKGP